jgi:hypothetical protein
MFEILEHYMELGNPHTEASARVRFNDEMVERLYRLVRTGGENRDVRALNEYHPDWSRAFNDSEEMRIEYEMDGGKTSRRKRTKKSRTTGGKKSRKQRKRTTLKGGKRKRRRTRRRR